MKGTKRFGVSDSTPDTNDSFFQSKRIMVGSQFDFHRADPSQKQSMETLPLDVRRAESSRQHVRALNSQFASWVQTQLQNHPDELWEDGVRDYLTHASNIMEKFSDVVNWLKANSTKAESVPALGSQTAQKNLVSESKDNEINWLKENGTKSESVSALGSQTAQKKFDLESKDNEIKLFPEKTGIAQAGTTAGFSTSWGSGALLNNQTPFSFGGQSSIPFNQDASNDADGDDDIEQPSSPSVKKTEEIGVNVVHEVKCKLYVKSSDPADKDAWKDKGAGQLSIKCKEGVSKGSRDSKPTILVRNDVGKVLLNALLYPGIKTSMQKNSIVAIFHTSDDSENDGDNNGRVVARTFLIRTKSEEDRNKLAAVIHEYAPAA